MYRSEKILALVFVGISVLIFTASFNITDKGGLASAAFFPKLFSIILAVLSILLLIRTIIKEKQEKTSESCDNERDGKAQRTLPEIWGKQKYVVLMIVLVVLYNLVLKYLGYLISTFLLLAITVYMLGANKKYPTTKAMVVSMGFSLIATLCTYLLFTGILNIILPEGIFAF